MLGKSQSLCNQTILEELAGLTDLFTEVGVSGETYLSSCVKQGYAPAAAALTFSACAAATPTKGLQLISGKMHAHTGVTSTYAAGALEIAPEGYIEISVADADKAGIADGAQVSVKSAVGSASGVARISGYVPQGILFAPYHFAGLNIQQVVPTGQNTVAVEISKG